MSGLSDDRLHETRESHEILSNPDKKLTDRTIQHEKEGMTTFQSFIEEWMTQTSSQLNSLEFRLQMVMEDALHHAEQIGSLQGVCEILQAKMKAVQPSGLPRGEQEETLTQDMEKEDGKMEAIKAEVTTGSSTMGSKGASECTSTMKCGGMAPTIPAGQDYVDAAFDRWLASRGNISGRGAV
eukprot:gnl/TRDRNA2_/TRDRNA2_176873_c3_seq3.p1 gnl/TRDRNA2_/TRDRNA2_176873_c3~~gnl/TRDRNA2_/TRDRNA2_176873_c3_seq3.p1  ORF type:complete len:182 (-),score=41.04 gnl/TRDRNA2_/TRDRNA2_176873_c3_seq3:414-959(-)